MGFADSTASPWIANATVTSTEARYALAAAFSKPPTSSVNAEPGVVPSSSNPFQPSSNGTSGSPSAAIAPGQCVVVNTIGGTYICTLPSSVTVDIATPLPSGSNTRKDLLCARVLDSEAGDGGGQTNRLRLETVTGTSAATPTTPSAPAGWLPLFVVTVTSGGTLTFSDVRTYTRAVGGVRFVQSNDTRDGSHQGDLRIFSTGQIDAWLGIKWVTVVAPSIWTQVNVNYTFAGGGGVSAGTMNFGSGGSSFCRYKRSGNDLSISYAGRWGGSGGYNGGVGNITTVLPNGWVTPSGRDQWVPCQLWAHTLDFSWSGDIPGLALIQASSNIVRPYFQTNVGDVPTAMGPYKIADSIGVPGHSVPFVGSSRMAEGGAIHIGPATIELAS